MPLRGSIEQIPSATPRATLHCEAPDQIPLPKSSRDAGGSRRPRTARGRLFRGDWILGRCARYRRHAPRAAIGLLTRVASGRQPNAVAIAAHAASAYVAGMPHRCRSSPTTTKNEMTLKAPTAMPRNRPCAAFAPTRVCEKTPSTPAYTGTLEIIPLHSGPRRRASAVISTTSRVATTMRAGRSHQVAGLVEDPASGRPMRTTSTREAPE